MVNAVGCIGQHGDRQVMLLLGINAMICNAGPLAAGLYCV